MGSNPICSTIFILKLSPNHPLIQWFLYVTLYVTFSPELALKKHNIGVYVSMKKKDGHFCPSQRKEDVFLLETPHGIASASAKFGDFNSRKHPPVIPEVASFHAPPSGIISVIHDA